MATAPWFVISPNTLLSVIGLLHGPDKIVPTPTEDWRNAIVDVVIPAYKEEDNIVYCLASVARQTMKPRNVIVVDDGGHDDTIPRARAFAASCGMNLTVIERATSIGKTPTIKRQSREFDADVEFILDGDTFLEHPNYIERCTEELFKGLGIASACGTILPMRLKDREAMAQTPDFQAYLAGAPHVDAYKLMGDMHLAWWAITRILGYTVIPFTVWKILFPKDSLLDMGLRVRGLLSHAWIYIVCLAVVVPAVFIVASQPDFGNYYPFYKKSSRSWFDFVVWESLYVAQFLGLEIFFRGFWLNTLRKSMGSTAIFAMTVPY